MGPGDALRAELMANAVVTAHNHVLRRWLRGDTDRPEAEFDEAMEAAVDLFAEPSENAIVILRTDTDLHALLPKLGRLL